MNLQFNSAGPGFRTPQAARGVARRALRWTADALLLAVSGGSSVSAAPP